MWRVIQHRNLRKKMRKLPKPVREKYLKWVDVIEQSGPEQLKKLTGLHDESLSGQLKGHRSSRLGLQYRVIYQIQSDLVLVLFIDINAHDYRIK
jgi:addiction module RelE/StbE family toxin